MDSGPAKSQTVSYDRLIKAGLQKYYPDLAEWLIGERPEEVRAVDPVMASTSLRFADKLLFLKFKRDAPGLLHKEFFVKLVSEIRNMSENYVFKLLRDEGEAIGLVKGREEGLEKGMEKGLQEGAKKEARQAILRVLSKRFGAYPPDLPARLDALSGLQEIESLIDEAVVCSTPEEFLALI